MRVPSKTLHRYTEELSKHFGGATVAPKQIGCWFNQWAEPPKHECEEVMRIIVARELDTGDSWPIDPESNEKVASEVRMNQLDREFVNKITKQMGIELGQWVIFETEKYIDITMHPPPIRKGAKSLKIPEKIETEGEVFSRLLE